MLADEVRRRRKSLHLTQQELSSETKKFDGQGVSTPTISRLENDRSADYVAGLDILQPIAWVLGCEWQDLVKEDPRFHRKAPQSSSLQNENDIVSNADLDLFKKITRKFIQQGELTPEDILYNVATVIKELRDKGEIR